MTIQQLATPGGKGGVTAALFNDAGRAGKAGGGSFASTLRDSIDRSAEKDRPADDDLHAAPAKKRSNAAARRDDENQPENTGPNTADAPRTASRPAEATNASQGDRSDAAQAGQDGAGGNSAENSATNGTANAADDTALSLTPAGEHGNDMQGETTGASSLFAQDLSRLAGMLKGMHGSADGAAGPQVKLATGGNNVPGGGKELPPGLQLTMDSGMAPAFSLDGASGSDAAGMPGFVDTNLLTDIPLLKSGSEQAGQNPAQSLQGPLLSALAPARDARLTPETSATATNLQLYSNAEMGSDAWMDDFGTKIQWLQNMKLSSADMTLHPAELGSLEIRIVTEDNNTKVTIVTQTGAARDIIDSTLPRLREMLASHGMELEQGSVSQQTAEDRRQQHSHRDESFIDSDDVLTEVSTRQQSRLLAAGQIDHYV